MSDELLRRLDDVVADAGNFSIREITAIAAKSAARIRALEADYAQAIFALEQS